jgi:hypothetical protein
MCEADHSPTCNNVTESVVPVHAISIVGGVEVQIQLFTTSSLDGDVFNFTAGRFTPVGSKTAMDVLDRRKTFYTHDNQTPNFRLPKQ